MAKYLPSMDSNIDLIGDEIVPSTFRQKIPSSIWRKRFAYSVALAMTGAFTWWAATTRHSPKWITVTGVVLALAGTASIAYHVIMVSIARDKPRIGPWVTANARTARYTVPYRLMKRLRLLMFSAVSVSVMIFASLLVMWARGDKSTSTILTLILAALLTAVIVLRARQTRPEPLGKDSVAVDARKLARRSHCKLIAWAPSDHNLPGLDPRLGYEARTLLWSRLDEEKEPGVRRYALWCVRAGRLSWRLLGVQALSFVEPCVLEIDGNKCRLLTGVRLLIPWHDRRQGHALGLDRIQLSMDDETGIGTSVNSDMDPRAPRWESGVVTLYLQYDGVGSAVCKPATRRELLKTIDRRS